MQSAESSQTTALLLPKDEQEHLQTASPVKEQQQPKLYEEVAKHTSAMGGFAFSVSYVFFARFLGNAIWMAFVGQYLGAKMLHAFALGYTTLNMFGHLAMGISYAMESLTSYAHGAQNQRVVGILFQRSLILQCIFGFGVGILQCFSNYMLLALGQDPEIVAEAIFFIRLSILHRFLCNINGFLDKFLEARKVVITGVISHTLADILLSLLFGFIFVSGHVFKFPGLIGVCIGMVTMRLCCLGILFLLVWYGKHYEGWWFGWDLQQALNGSKVWQMTKLAIPAGLVLTVDIHIDDLWIMIAGLFGTTVTNAFAVSNQMNQMIFWVSRGMGVGTAVSMGHALGQKQPKSAMVILGIGIASSLLVAVVTASFTLVFRNYIPYMFTQDEPTVKLAANCLYFVAILIVLNTGRTVLNAALRAFSRHNTSLLMLVITFYFIAVPSALLLSVVNQYEVYGILMGQVIGYFNNLVALLICVYVIYDWNRESERALERIKEHRK